jgi:NAD(P)-dependent dehydrogenase (short-subunit alcohol dehydrogenase family)
MSKVWLITGANRGIGLGIARAVLEAGHKVVATARKPEQIEAALGGDDNRLLAVALDITQPVQAADAIAKAKAKFGRIDVLVNNAGYGQLGWFENTSADQIFRQFETNVFGSMHVTRAVLPTMREQRSGHVFTISSIAGINSVAGGAIYSSSKFAVEGWMVGFAQEVRPLGIAATLIEPGFFNTDFLDNISVTYGEYDIPDYREAFTKFKQFHDDMNHRQVGDPLKLGKVMTELAEMKEPPVRFAAGSDSVALVLQVAENLRSQAEKYKSLSISTDRNA